MGGFADLDAYLTQEFSVDYWADDAILHAQELVRGLAEADWDEIEKAWPGRPAEWQEHAAQALSHGTPARAVPVLVAMVTEGGEDDVVEAAADSLRDLGSAESPLAVPATLIERVDRLAAARPGVVAKVMADLRRRIRAAD